MKTLFAAVVALSAMGVVFAGPPASAPKPKASPKVVAAAAPICPVEGGKVTNVAKAEKSTYKGKTYYFCCAGCKPAFDKDPAKYLKTVKK